MGILNNVRISLTKVIRTLLVILVIENSYIYNELIIEDKYNYFRSSYRANKCQLDAFRFPSIHYLTNCIGKLELVKSGLPGVYKCGSVTILFFWNSTNYLYRPIKLGHLLSHGSGPVTYLSSKGMRH